jgi:hypothetical protein
MGGAATELPFEGGMIVKMIECVKTENEYDKKTLQDKMAFKADVILEFTDKIVEIVRQSFTDVPAFDPMFMGQHIRRTMERLFPDHMQEMQFRWVPYLLSSETAAEFPACLESDRYVALRQAAFRMMNEPSFKELPEEEKAYLTGISDGRMPMGVLGTHHCAWLICDPLRGNQPINSGAVHRFLEEQKLPSGTPPRTEAEIVASIAGEI